MTSPPSPDAAAGGSSAVERYYRLHARIYDATRWSFLFGRDAILRDIAAVASPRRILEVGCGTGKNLESLARRFPAAALTGVDLSAEMLERAQRKTTALGARVQLAHHAYNAPLQPGAHDLVLFAYALSMFNPGFEAALAAARADLAPGGHIAVVDFHDTPASVFKRWMAANHVRMEGQLRPLLRAQFALRADRIHAAYGGLWRYLMFVGRKEN